MTQPGAAAVPPVNWLYPPEQGGRLSRRKDYAAHAGALSGPVTPWEPPE